MTKRKTKQPLDSFDHNFIQLMIAAAKKRIVIPFIGPGGLKRAQSFRRRLHTARVRMRDENHEHATLVSCCTARLFWGNRAVAEGLVSPEEHPAFLDDNTGLLGAYLIIEPTDAQFEDIFAQLSDITGPHHALQTITLSPIGEESLDSILDLALTPPKPEGEK